MLEDVFVIDGVAHAFDMSPENFADERHGRSTTRSPVCWPLRPTVIASILVSEDFCAEHVALPRGGGVGDLTAEIDAWREAGGTHLSG